MSTALILLSEFQKTEIELWRPVVGYEGYDVSSLGRVRSWRMAGGQKGNKGIMRIYRRATPLILKQSVKDTDRLQVSLCANGRALSIQVHLIVGRTFLSNPDGFSQLNHKTGNHRDNRVGNLEWTTRERDLDHALEFGLVPYGERISGAKLTRDKVRRIFSAYQSGVSTRKLAKEYGVSQTSIARICVGKTWVRAFNDIDAG